MARALNKTTRSWTMGVAGAAALLAMASGPAMAQSKPAQSRAAETLKSYNLSQRKAVRDDFLKLLTFPAVAADAAGLRASAGEIQRLLSERGFASELWTAPGKPDGAPVVFAEWKVPGATRTVIFYAHYDGQPVTPADWATPPFQPTLRSASIEAGGKVLDPSDPASLSPDARVYARGAGDDKGGVMMLIAAMGALKAKGITPTVNVKLVFEGEEEVGSVNLGEILRANRARLDGDLWVVCDGPMPEQDRIQLVYGVRGDMHANLTVYGPERPLHSGHYGNWAPNPGLALAKLLGAMKDDRGRVVIDGWYDGIEELGARERKALQDLAVHDRDVMADIGIAAAESDLPLHQAVTLPSLNINGMKSGEVGKAAANVIPTKAEAVLDMRLVPGETQAGQLGRLSAWIAKQGYHVLDRAPTAEERRAHPKLATLTTDAGVYPASRTPMDHPLAASFEALVQKSSGLKVSPIPLAGGTAPLAVLTEATGAPSILVTFANVDDMQHAANENLRLGNLWLGVDVLSVALASPWQSGPAKK